MQEITGSVVAVCTSLWESYSLITLPQEPASHISFETHCHCEVCRHSVSTTVGKLWEHVLQNVLTCPLYSSRIQIGTGWLHILQYPCGQSSSWQWWWLGDHFLLLCCNTDSEFVVLMPDCTSDSVFCCVCQCSLSEGVHKHFFPVCVCFCTLWCTKYTVHSRNIQNGYHSDWHSINQGLLLTTW